MHARVLKWAHTHRHKGICTLPLIHTASKSLFTHTHAGFQNPHAFGCRVLRGELPAARVVLSNKALKWREHGRGVKRGGEKKAQSAEYVFWTGRGRLSKQAWRHNMHEHPCAHVPASTHTYTGQDVLMHPKWHKNVYTEITDTHAHTHTLSG